MKKLIIMITCAFILAAGVVRSQKSQVIHLDVVNLIKDLTAVCKGVPSAYLVGDMICAELLQGSKSYVASLIKTPEDMDTFKETLINRCETSSAEVCKNFN